MSILPTPRICAACGMRETPLTPATCEAAGKHQWGTEPINHPTHYGGDTPYEAIKVIEAWGLGFCLGNTVKYISRAGKKGDALTDLRKAAWYLQHEIERMTKNGNE